MASGIGSDWSANAASIPIVGFVLLSTVPVTQYRQFVEVQNQSAGTIQVVLDDGAGNQITSILLTGVGANTQGGGWSSDTFTGRIRTYGATGSQVSIRQE